MNKEDGTTQEPAVVYQPIELISSDGEISLKQYIMEDAAKIFAVIDRNRNHLSQNFEDTADKYGL